MGTVTIALMLLPVVARADAKLAPRKPNNVIPLADDQGYAYTAFAAKA